MSGFYSYARRAVDPKIDLPTRRNALKRCLKVLAEVTEHGFRLSGFDSGGSENFWTRHTAYLEAKRSYRQGLFRRFAGLLGLLCTLETADAEDIVAVTNAAQVEYHRLRQTQRVLERRRVVLKARGIRQTGCVEHEKQALYWRQALEDFERRLGP